ALYDSAEALRVIAIFGASIMPVAAERLWEQLGMGESLSEQVLPGAAQWGLIPPATKTNRGEPLFPRLDA
ncbi:MAG: methionine--tRNA ligase, partial [Actinomycetota bacterium]